MRVDEGRKGGRTMKMKACNVAGRGENDLLMVALDLSYQYITRELGRRRKKSANMMKG